jgi:hypothetical protein
MATLNNNVVSINGAEYVTLGEIETVEQPAFTPGFNSLGGQQRFESQQVASSVRFPVPIRGFGRRRITDWNDPEQYQYFWDAVGVETRWPSAVALGLYEEESADLALGTNPKGVLRASVSHNNQFMSIWDANKNGTSGIFLSHFDGSATGWVLLDSVFGSGTPPYLAQSIMSHKTEVIILAAYLDDHLIYHSADGTSLAAAAAQPTAAMITGNITDQGSNKKYGLLAQVGNEAHAVLFHEDISTITFFTSTNAGANWTDEEVDIPSAGGPNGVVVYPGLDGADKLYVGTQEGVWEVDTSPSTWTTSKILGMPAQSLNCLGMIVHQGKIWVSVGADVYSPAAIYTIEHAGDTRIINQGMGLDVNDGVPVDLLGSVYQFEAAGKFLFASIGGVNTAATGSSRRARIICHNGLGWHTMNKRNSGNVRYDWLGLSDKDDGESRLHYTVRGGTASTLTLFFADPLVNPISGTTAARAATGTLVRPEIDGGMPNVPAVWLEASMDASELGSATTGNFIDVDYGLEGATPDVALWTATTGCSAAFISSDKDHPFQNTAGESVGVSGASVQIEETLHQDDSDTTLTPFLRSTVVKYLKRPAAKNAWRMTIDLAASARRQVTSSIEGVKAALENTRSPNQVALYAFTHALLGTKYVLTESLSFKDIVSPDSVSFGSKNNISAAEIVIREV